MKIISKSYKNKDREKERDRKSKRNMKQCVQKYTLTNTSNTFLTNHQKQECGTDKYENAQAATIEFSRRQDPD